MYVHVDFVYFIFVAHIVLVSPFTLYPSPLLYYVYLYQWNGYTTIHGKILIVRTWYQRLKPKSILYLRRIPSIFIHFFFLTVHSIMYDDADNNLKSNPTDRIYGCTNIKSYVPLILDLPQDELRLMERVI